MSRATRGPTICDPTFGSLRALFGIGPLVLLRLPLLEVLYMQQIQLTVGQEDWVRGNVDDLNLALQDTTAWSVMSDNGVQSDRVLQRFKYESRIGVNVIIPQTKQLGVQMSRPTGRSQGCAEGPLEFLDAVSRYWIHSIRWSWVTTPPVEVEIWSYVTGHDVECRIHKLVPKWPKKWFCGPKTSRKWLCTLVELRKIQKFRVFLF
ncbi:hypothetical protein K438DRAFT_1749744 [Mycena galopus ATCC 62051]|nr:hypothetical protein K438DRAFT_1749744 [Mycena galopus ATCC 62051]